MQHARLDTRGEVEKPVPGRAPLRAILERGRLVSARMQLEAGLVVGPVRSVAGDAHVARRHAFDRTVLVEQDLRSRESGENFDPELFRLFVDAKVYALVHKH